MSDVDWSWVTQLLSQDIGCAIRESIAAAVKESRRDQVAASIMASLCVPAIPCISNSNDNQECDYKATMAVRLTDALLRKLDEVQGV